MSDHALQPTKLEEEDSKAVGRSQGTARGADALEDATKGSKEGSKEDDGRGDTTREATLVIRDKPAIKSPPPPAPPPKDESLSKAVADDQKEYTDYDEKHALEDDTVVDPQKDTGEDHESRSEIQSIMDQFGDGITEEVVASPRRELPSPPFFPPRASSLDPDQQISPTMSVKRKESRDSYSFDPSKARPPSISEGLPPPPPPDSEKPETRSPLSPSGLPVFQPPPMESDPDASLPFDFHRFLEQLRHRTADPVARFLRSFLNEFGKKQWTVHEQVKIITDFLEFIAKKMSQCEVWRTVSDDEFDNAREGMEKLVMNRLYSQTFSPVIPPAEPITSAKTRRARAQAASPIGPGRRGQHQEDVERDEVIAQKIRIYGWVREEHLDIPAVGDKGRKFLSLAQQELLKINSYRAPRDKVIQILNCCKVIFGFLKNSKTDQSADSFVPLLIYTVLKANPAHLASNVQYILRFRNQDKLGGEAGYYISSLMGVISFVENLDRTNLTISNEEFEANVEAAVSAIAEGHNSAEYEASTSLAVNEAPSLRPTPTSATASPLIPSLLSGVPSGPTGKAAPSRAEMTPRSSSDGGESAFLSSPKRNASTSKRLTVDTGGSGATNPSGPDSDGDDIASGLLRTIQRPLTNIGRMFSDDAATPAPPQQVRSRYDPRSAGSTFSAETTPRDGSEVMRLFAGAGNAAPRQQAGNVQPPAVPPHPSQLQQQQQQQRQQGQQGRPPQQGYPGGRGGREREEAVRQLSAREAEAQRTRSEEHRLVVETLQGMFPDLDKDVISDVVRMKEGRVGVAVDACLALSN